MAWHPGEPAADAVTAPAPPTEDPVAAARTAWLAGDRDAWTTYATALRLRDGEPTLRTAGTAPARPVRRRRYRAAGDFRQYGR